MANNEYIASIGIECHVQLKTKTKLFSAISNDAREAQPNTLISHICLGLPGSLPVLNEAAIELASRAAFALNTKPQKFSKFDRKHYFYPDLPKGYQISQYDQPIVSGGFVEIEVGGKTKRIGITRAHLEEDAGKNIHPPQADYSLVDLNRAGTPLLEIVSEPDIHSAEEAKAYARELYLLMKYADVSDVDLYHGNMRFDVNVSVSREPKKLGTRSETKNLNSFKSVAGAVDYEIHRQIDLLKSGQSVVQETRGWDEAKQKTISQRGKEESHDYRYFPEPDIPPIELDEGFIEKIKSSMPVLPAEWRMRLKKLGLNKSYINTLLIADAEDERFSYLSLIEENMNDAEFAKALANWFINIEIPMRRSGQAIEFIKDSVRSEIYKNVHGLLSSSKLSTSSARSLLVELLKTGVLPENLEKYAGEQGYIQLTNEKELEKIIDEVIKENPTAAEAILKGEVKAIGFLVGQVMKKSLGQANPELTHKIIKDKLNDK